VQKNSGAKQIVIATDDLRIVDAVNGMAIK